MSVLRQEIIQQDHYPQGQKYPQGPHDITAAAALS